MRLPRLHPEAGVLLGTVADFLAELAPQLGAADRYRGRVAINILRIVQRELALGAASDEAEREDLAALLATLPAATRDGAAAQDAPDETLARAIRAGHVAFDDPALLAYLERSLERALRIDNPAWLPVEAAR